jgi:pyruvate dehydrogenase E2 component (dihydrolipoamide acetyltransferase)
MTDVLMPRLSDSMQEGTILTWLAADGDDIVEGQELVEVETDKATMTQLSEASGVLSIVVAEGTTIAVGEVIARLQPTEARAGAAAPSTAPEATAEPGAATTSELGAPASVVAATAPVADGSPPATVVANGSGPSGNGSATEVPATPMARRIADAHGIDLTSLAGSGPRGRVVRADVIAAAGLPADPPAAAVPARDPAPVPAARAAADAPPAADATAADATAADATAADATAADATAADAPGGGAPAADAPAAGGRGATERVALSRLQQLIARRMAEAKATIPEFQVQTEVEMTAAVGFRAQLKQLAESQSVPAPSLNDLIVKACALCLRRHPRANGSYADGAFELHERVNIGVAVAADDALVVPVIHDVDVKTLGQIAAIGRRLAESVRAGTITPPELSGATFTVSNLGMYGMTAITPVINPPQAAILGVGAIRDVLGRDADGEIVDRKLLSLTLSCDHRILYGADAATFLAAIKQLLESPLGLSL